jgi:hypothetical protein
MARGPLRFEAFGVPVEVVLEDRGLDPEVRGILPPGWKPTAASPQSGSFRLLGSGNDGYELIVDGRSYLQQASREIALGLLDAQVRLFIASNARDWVFVHAGVVARDGRALVIPGHSFSGKTTLVAALVSTGATYCSDEYAVLDRNGRVHPYARRLSFRDQRGEWVGDRPASDFGAVEMNGSAEVAVVVVTRYRPGAVWEPRRPSAGDGLVALLANTVPAQERPEECLRVLRRAIAGATVLQGDRGEAGSAAPALLEELTKPRIGIHGSR